MANTKLWRGDNGEVVKSLQEKLNGSGYGLDVDGVFGNKTYDAVLDYQKKNGLRVDGVVGDETWGHLNRMAAAAAGPSSGKQVLSGVSDETYDALYQLEQGYTPSDEVTAARQVKESLGAMRPGEYQSAFEEQLAELYDRIAGRKEFSYDPEADAAYQSYARLYADRGREAMENTMGAAAGLTGGFGSTYAQTAGQQAYGRYLQQLAELVPQLEENARKRYDQEGAALEQQYGMVQKQEAQAYDRWQDAMKAWQEAYDAAEQEAQTRSKEDYDRYKLMLNHFTSKASSEQKASDGARVNSGTVSGGEKKTESLSSVAMESLQRAMENYLKAGQSERAAALVSQYSGRMTPGQRKGVSGLFSRYGQSAGV